MAEPLHIEPVPEKAPEMPPQHAPENAADNGQDNSRGGRMVRAASLPAAAVAGGLVTHTMVRSQAYKTAKGFGAMDDLLAKHEPLARKNMGQRLSESISAEEFIGNSAINKSNYSRAVSERMEKLGLGSFVSKWRYIDRGNKQKAVIEGLTAFGITIGAMLTIANTKSLLGFFTGEDEKSR